MEQTTTFLVNALYLGMAFSLFAITTLLIIDSYRNGKRHKAYWEEVGRQQDKLRREMHEGKDSLRNPYNIE